MRPARRPSSRPLRPPSPDDAPTGRADLYRSPSRSLRRPSVRIPACGAAPETGIGTRETGRHPPSEADSVQYERDLDGGDVSALDAEVRHASAGQEPADEAVA